MDCNGWLIILLLIKYNLPEKKRGLTLGGSKFGRHQFAIESSIIQLVFDVFSSRPNV
jgi:hypothetical protein